jgi:hypothetical protein
VTTIINQPLATVVAHLRSVARGTEGQTAEYDPTFAVMHRSWGREVMVRYIVYAVPGGTQVTAAIEGSGGSRVDLRTSMAVRAISRQVATGLSTMRDDLE